LENGELPDTLQSGVFWVLIGTNDLGGDHCSTESIVAGNIQIVETIRSLRPNAKVVVNSILPRGDPGTDLFTGKSSWPTVATINRWLECYANENHNVEFFNGTSTFLQPTPNETTTVKEYYSDAVHPSRTGHAVWAAAIVERVLELVGH
jgi:lysophospholipase L1-like esterase